MARMEITGDVALGDVETPQFKVVLSRRNLLALLHKLDMEGSARTITNDYVYLNGTDVNGPNRHFNRRVEIVLTSEDDGEHYHQRETAAGMMHPETELFIASAL